eukprot:6713278-Prymnesium_polylepis.2
MCWAGLPWYAATFSQLNLESIQGSGRALLTPTLSGALRGLVHALLRPWYCGCTCVLRLYGLGFPKLRHPLVHRDRPSKARHASRRTASITHDRSCGGVGCTPNKSHMLTTLNTTPLEPAAAAPHTQSLTAGSRSHSHEPQRSCWANIRPARSVLKSVPIPSFHAEI